MYDPHHFKALKGTITRLKNISSHKIPFHTEARTHIEKAVTELKEALNLLEVEYERYATT